MTVAKITTASSSPTTTTSASSSTIARLFSVRGAITIISVVVVLVVAGVLSNYRQEVKAFINAGRQGRVGQRSSSSSSSLLRHKNDSVVIVDESHSNDDDENSADLVVLNNLPEILLTKGIYSKDSFVNENGVIPSFWEGTTTTSNTIGPCYYQHPQQQQQPSPTTDWKKEVEEYNASGQQPWYNKGINTNFKLEGERNVTNFDGYCRPGFIIIGAGKCGTSSLYHYLTMHPRVLPASEKQIHYFRYFKHQPLKWYYNHFPSTESFLAAGALMTGEASPGYLPYPQVVIDMEQKMKQPRLVVIGRNPIERSYSSYKYNYVNPHIEYLRKHGKGGPRGGKMSKADLQNYYMDRYLFTFEEMIRAELDVLKECFLPGSQGQQQTQKEWSTAAPWIQKEYQRRKEQGIPPLLDLDGFCYGKGINPTILRKQWSNLLTQQPNKIILDRNTHLTQSLIGRSLYLFPLEWWYAAYAYNSNDGSDENNNPQEHIYFVCTEELKDFTGESMNQIGQFLGLPRYEEFGKVVQHGAYNVGGHKGYDTEVSWGQINAEHQNDEQIPLSDELQLELEEFLRPYNERLYNLTGRRCSW